MNDLMSLIMIVLVMEIIGHGLFLLIARWNDSKAENSINFRAVMKGLLERTFITAVLVVDLPHALTVFAALKIATRIKDDSKVSNDFFLIGNIISLSMAILYFVSIDRILMN